MRRKGGRKILARWKKQIFPIWQLTKLPRLINWLIKQIFIACPFCTRHFLGVGDIAENKTK